MTKAFVLFLCFALFGLFPGVAEEARREFSGEFTPANNGERLLAFLVSLTDPESMDLEMDAIPGDDGAILALSLSLHGGLIGGIRVERLSLSSAFVQLNPPSEWIRGNRHSFRMLNALRTNFKLVVDERDVLEALETYASVSWSDIRVKLDSEGLRAQGRFRPDATAFSLLAGIATKLEIRDGDRVVLKSPQVYINGEEKTVLFQRDLERLRPLLDFNGLPLSPMLSRLSIDKGKLLLGTATPPRPVEGVQFRYVRDNKRPFVMHPPESYGIPTHLFRNGDILLVCGKTWRSKIVNLVDDGDSSFTHSGIIRVIDGVPHVIHASPETELVQMERAEVFLSPEKVDRASLFRVREDPAAAAEASLNALKYYEERVHFDSAFDGEDHGSLYCTELIWIAYEQAGIDLADGLWYRASNPVINGRLLLPNSLSRSPLLEEAAVLR